MFSYKNRLYGFLEAIQRKAKFDSLGDQNPIPRTEGRILLCDIIPG